MRAKRIIITVLIIAAAAAAISFLFLRKENIKSGNIEAVKYNMKLNLDTHSKSLTEDVEIEIENNTGKSVKELVLRDMTGEIHGYNKENYGIDRKSNIEGIFLGGRKLDYKEDKGIITVKLSEELKENSSADIRVKMSTDIPDRQDRFGYVKRGKGYIYALSFCFPYLADNKNGKWITHPYFDDGESRNPDLCDYEIEINHPSGYTVISPGKTETDGETTKITAKNIRDMALVVSNMMKKDSFKAEGIKINNYYLESKRTEKYRKLTKLVIEEAFKVYTEKVGKYPYAELNVAPMLFGFGYGGMEYPGIIMTNATSFYDGAMTDPLSLSEGLSHEIAHQWFYGAVGNDEYAEGWIDEGFTTYLERQIFGLYDGETNKYLREIDELALTVEGNKKSIDELLETARSDYKNLYLNISPDNYDVEEQGYGTTEYEEAFMFLEEIRLAMGDKKFDKFLKEFYKEYTFKTVNTKEVLKFIRKYDNGKKVNEIIGFYFKQ